uniref:Terpene cyclase spdB n=1 Tax=Cordana terrestris TaxID=1293529 RepID=SPDB_CORTS|nr:putative membrane protein [Cordana terrestris]
MDGFNNLQPPKEYQQIQWIADIFVTLMGVGWIVNYATMIWHAYTESTYSMALLPLCSNIGWELTFVLVYPSPNPYEFGVFASLLTLNLGIMITAARAAPAEWAHSPLVANYAVPIFLIGILICFGGHVCLAAQIGPGLAYSWGAFICQLGLSVGAICQLLQRNSTRGTSWIMWLGRFLGSCCTVVFAALRWKYWPEVFSWLGSPLMLWGVGVFFASELAYGLCFYLVQKSEVETKKSIKAQ